MHFPPTSSTVTSFTWHPWVSLGNWDPARALSTRAFAREHTCSRFQTSLSTPCSVAPSHWRAGNEANDNNTAFRPQPALPTPVKPLHSEEMPPTPPHPTPVCPGHALPCRGQHTAAHPVGGAQAPSLYFVSGSGSKSLWPLDSFTLGNRFLSKRFGWRSRKGPTFRLQTYQRAPCGHALPPCSAGESAILAAGSSSSTR